MGREVEVFLNGRGVYMYLTYLLYLLSTSRFRGLFRRGWEGLKQRGDLGITARDTDGVAELKLYA